MDACNRSVFTFKKVLGTFRGSATTRNCKVGGKSLLRIPKQATDKMTICFLKLFASTVLCLFTFRGSAESHTFFLVKIINPLFYDFHY